MMDTGAVIGWLLDPERSDPSIRWQVMRDLLDSPRSEWAAERAKVETEGWGARLLALEDEDGQWAAGAHFPGDFDFSGPEARRGPDGRIALQPWTATTHSLSQLREFGLDPASDGARRVVELVGANARWEEGGQPYWEGEVEPCINGVTVANGAYFGVDVSSIVERLVGERLDDGGWNCEAESGSIRSSFATTINVLEGLVEYERSTGGTGGSRAARHSGEEYLRERSLFRRLSTGELADERFLHLLHPDRWHYHVLRGLDHFRSAAALTGAAPDARLSEAIERVRSRRSEDGTWPLDGSPPGRVWFEVDDGQGEPSRWVTLRAMRVLRWWEEEGYGVRSPRGFRETSSGSIGAPVEEQLQPRIVRDDQRLRRSDLQTAGLHREQAFSSDGLWVGVVITEPGDMSAWHHHGDHDTYAYVVSGSKRIEHGPGGAQWITAGPGDFIHIPRGLIHREGNPSAETSRSIAFRQGSGPATINVEGPADP